MSKSSSLKFKQQGNVCAGKV